MTGADDRQPEQQAPPASPTLELTAEVRDTSPTAAADAAIYAVTTALSERRRRVMASHRNGPKASSPSDQIGMDAQPS
jgi:hypothetical protein